MKFYIGIDVGGTKIAYGLFDEARKLLVRKQTASDDQKEGQEFFEPVLEIIREFMEEAGNRGGTVEGIGIGITGFVDFEKGALTKTASLPKLNNFAVVDYLKFRISASSWTMTVTVARWRNIGRALAGDAGICCTVRSAPESPAA